MENTTAIILAAGKGTRMRSTKPKVLHEVCGISLLERVIRAVREAGIQRIVVIVGEQKEIVKESIKEIPVEIVEQREQLGTGHAVLSAKNYLSEITGIVLVLNGDTPLIKSRTLKNLVSTHVKSCADATLLTARLKNPQGYGRILRNPQGSVERIVEENEAGDEELKIKEVNAGIYVFTIAALLKGLEEIVPNNKKGEFYLTDIISIFHRKGRKIAVYTETNTTEVVGINTQQELAAVNRLRCNEIIRSFMDRGVTIVDPETTFIEDLVEIGDGTTVYPFTYICKNVNIGRRCTILPFTYLKPGTKIQDDMNVKSDGGLFYL